MSIQRFIWKPQFTTSNKETFFQDYLEMFPLYSMPSGICSMLKSSNTLYGVTWVQKVRIVCVSSLHEDIIHILLKFLIGRIYLDIFYNLHLQTIVTFIY